MNGITVIFGIIDTVVTGVSPRWGILGVLILGGAILVWSFSASYIYHWKMFGNTIITEVYSSLHGPKNG
jgi:hypothetical protein